MKFGLHYNQSKGFFSSNNPPFFRKSCPTHVLCLCLTKMRWQHSISSNTKKPPANRVLSNSHDGLMFVFHHHHPPTFSPPWAWTSGKPGPGFETVQEFTTRGRNLHIGSGVGKERATCVHVTTTVACCAKQQSLVPMQSRTVQIPTTTERKPTCLLVLSKAVDKSLIPPVIWPRREGLPNASGTSGETSQREKEESYRPAGRALAGFPGT